MEPKELSDFLSTCTRQDLIAAFSTEWFNRCFPGAHLLPGCGQGNTHHMEGDVAQHTALVLETMRTVAQRRLQRAPDFVELLSVILHDLDKPAVRKANSDGSVAFPGHEALGAGRVPSVAKQLGLVPEERERLLFVVARHGEAHFWPRLAEHERSAIRQSPWRPSLALLQESDALSCLMPDGTTLPVLWDQIMGS